MSQRARQHLPFLAFLSERVNAYCLYIFSEDPDNEFGQVYRVFFNENLQKHDWFALLNEAAETGILERFNEVGEAVYKIHPALPWYLRQRLSEQHTTQEVSDLEKKLLIFYAALAGNYRDNLIGNAELASLVLQVEEPNLLQYLRLAEQQRDWSKAVLIVQALGELYQRLDYKPKFRALRQRVLMQIGVRLSDAKAEGQDAFWLWRYLRGMDANDALDIADWEAAKAINQEILDELIASNDPSLDRSIAVFFHQLGVVAQNQRQFEEAHNHYQKALQISEDAKDNYNAAREYFNLGILAQEQEQFEQAKVYYQKALQIRKNAGDDYNAAEVYNSLGVLAVERQQFEEAISFYKRALQIYGDVGNDYHAATVCHNLGVVAEHQRQFEEASFYFLKALQIREDNGNNYLAADEYYSLGRLAQELGQCQEAIAYYEKALDIFQESKDWYKFSTLLGRYGNLLEAQEFWTEALQIYIQSLGIDLQHNRETVGCDLRDFGRMFKVMGQSQFETVWQEMTGEELTEEWRSAIQEASEENEE